MSAAAKAFGDGGGVIWRGGPQADTGRAIALLSEEGGVDRAVDIHQVAGQAVVHIRCGATRALEFATKDRPDDAALFFFSSRRRHTRWNCDWTSDVCSSD